MCARTSRMNDDIVSTRMPDKPITHTRALVIRLHSIIYIECDAAITIITQHLCKQRRGRIPRTPAQIIRRRCVGCFRCIARSAGAACVCVCVCSNRFIDASRASIQESFDTNNILSARRLQTSNRRQNTRHAREQRDDERRCASPSRSRWLSSPPRCNSIALAANTSITAYFGLGG